MLAVKVTITRVVDSSQPGWIECLLTDIDGVSWSFIEKIPVITLDDLDNGSKYPLEGSVACSIVKTGFDSLGKEVITIDTGLPWHIESTAGTTQFVVYPDQLVKP